MAKTEPTPESGEPASDRRRGTTITTHWSVSLTVVILIVSMVATNLSWLFSVQSEAAVLDTKLNTLTQAFEKQSEKTDSKLDALAKEITWLKVELASTRAASNK